MNQKQENMKMAKQNRHTHVKSYAIFIYITQMIVGKQCVKSLEIHR